MKLDEYIDYLNLLKIKFGDDLKLVFARDVEGNGYEDVYFIPTSGYIIDEDYLGNSTFKPSKDKRKVTHICIN